MLGLDMLDVLIGLVTIYLVFALACTAIVEAVASWLSLRSRNLDAALREFLAGDLKPGTAFLDAFYRHPLVQALSNGENGRPSYIPPQIVGQVVEALLTARGNEESVVAAVQLLPDTWVQTTSRWSGWLIGRGDTSPAAAPDTNRIKGLLDTLAKQAADVAKFREAVATHFDAVMDRASGWYKRRTQTVALVAAAVLVLFANLDTIVLVKSLASSPAARVKMVEIAEQNVKAAGGSAEAKQALEKTTSAMESAGLQFGWTASLQDSPLTVTRIAGLLVSIFAVSLGAPFWFDLLQRFMQVRAAGTTPGEKDKEEKGKEK